jgi:hypothetical protein
MLDCHVPLPDSPSAGGLRQRIQGRLDVVL